ncbi:hypothetical protein K490DRAFT_59048 [Saccharata proteae CBS 121410]|uniref:Uncharacterized protein n=1 Tax=Saccharata proteae CBS 121410 TaxID=1314787 RepID=A0A9P4HR12_9PEZI|nr:hypothetical protein K490DRAFT_59048 [Saccharata proteae CBS 121410]
MDIAVAAVTAPVAILPSVGVILGITGLFNLLVLLCTGFISYAQLALELPPIENLHCPGRCPVPVVCGPCPPTVATAGPSNFTFLAACFDDDHHPAVFGVKHVRDLMLTPDPLNYLFRSGRVFAGRLFGEHGDEPLVDPEYLQVNTTAVDIARKRYKKLLTVWHVDKTWRTGLDTLQHQIATQIITTAWQRVEDDLNREVRTRESRVRVLRTRFPSIYSGFGETGHVRGSKAQNVEGKEDSTTEHFNDEHFNDEHFNAFNAERYNAEHFDAEDSNAEDSDAEDPYTESDSSTPAESSMAAPRNRRTVEQNLREFAALQENAVKPPPTPPLEARGQFIPQRLTRTQMVAFTALVLSLFVLVLGVIFFRGEPFIHIHNVGINVPEHRPISLRMKPAKDGPMTVPTDPKLRLSNNLARIEQVDPLPSAKSMATLAKRISAQVKRIESLQDWAMRSQWIGPQAMRIALSLNKAADNLWNLTSELQSYDRIYSTTVSALHMYLDEITGSIQLAFELEARGYEAWDPENAFELEDSIVSKRLDPFIRWLLDFLLEWTDVPSAAPSWKRATERMRPASCRFVENIKDAMGILMAEIEMRQEALLRAIDSHQPRWWWSTSSVVSSAQRLGVLRARLDEAEATLFKLGELLDFGREFEREAMVHSMDLIRARKELLALLNSCSGDGASCRGPRLNLSYEDKTYFIGCLLMELVWRDDAATGEGRAETMRWWRQSRPSNDGRRSEDINDGERR